MAATASQAPVIMDPESTQEQELDEVAITDSLARLQQLHVAVCLTSKSVHHTWASALSSLHIESVAPNILIREYSSET